MIKEINELKNKEKNKDIYILANAPSVKNENLSLLKDKIVIGMNANPLLEEKFDFIAKYYVVSDTRFMSHKEKIKLGTEKINNKTKRIFRNEIIELDNKIDQERTDTYFVNSIGKNGFSFNLDKGFYFGCTTTMLAVQLAYYLGAKNIYILGMDLKYNGEVPRFYKEKIVQEFDDFTGVQIHNIRNAYLTLKEEGITLYNCSKNSLLYPYLPFVKFNDTIKGNNK